MYYEINFYYVDRNRDFKFSTLEEAKAFAKELSKEVGYYPCIKADILIID